MAVATARDRAAFGRLFEHYKDRAYNLAYHITGRAEAAEEAVQEAMLRVWTAAATFKPGNADGWVLRIVARESLKALRTRKKDRKEMAIEREREHAPRETAPGEDLERDELLVGLRGAIAGLDPAARRLVALYFGAGMTQEEIAQELELSQRGVSYKIDEALAALKRRLAQAGLAAVLPMLNAKGLSEALCTGARAPAGIENAVFQSLGQVLRESVKHSVRGASYGGSVLGWAIAAVLVAVGAGGAWYLNETSAPATSAPAAKADAKTEAPPVVQEARATNELKLPLKWTFEKGTPEELKPFFRDWVKHAPAKDGLPARLVPGGGVKNTVYFLLPKGLPARPFVVSFDLSLNREDMPDDSWFGKNIRSGLHVLWSVGLKGAVPHRGWFRKQSMEGVSGNRVVLRQHVYALGRFLIRTDEKGVPYDVVAVSAAYPTDEVCVSVNGYALESIEICELKDEDIPEPLRDWEQLGEEIVAGTRGADGWVPKESQKVDEVYFTPRN
ncbi:MAG: sigma-70 family RNA polymerase sigma factor [Planctomycetes bacterium]|nr:sigma-70 family RNA polymerase sigma factor [Planctomycetota bacterium]